MRSSAIKGGSRGSHPLSRMRARALRGIPLPQLCAVGGSWEETTSPEEAAASPNKPRAERDDGQMSFLRHP